ncbi:MAG TPA: DUF4019 domain-containing protein [Longimicrobiales bacterium]|nr:DUF4019 domain-containing protein [Longimicrobiales bacterium]
MKIAYVLTMATLLAGCAAAPVPAPAPEPSSQVVADRTPEAAARAWLAQIDRGEWEPAWTRMIPMFRSSVSMEQWRGGIVEGRTRYPVSGQRTLVNTARGTDMFPDAVQLTFRNDRSVETVVLVPGGDGWLIGGYGMSAGG